MSPVTQTPGLTPTADSTAKGAVELSARDAGLRGTDAAASVAVERPVTVPNLNPGKPIPGPDDWRALERRASSLRV